MSCRFLFILSILYLVSVAVAIPFHFNNVYGQPSYYNYDYSKLTLGDGECKSGVPHYIRISLAYDPTLCLTTGGKEKTEQYLLETFRSSQAIFKRDTCIRLELVGINGFCDPTFGLFGQLFSPFRTIFSRSAFDMHSGFNRWGLPSLPIPKLPSVGLPNIDDLAKAIDPTKATDVFRQMYDQAFGTIERDLVVFVSGLPFDSLNLAITIPGNICLPAPVQYAWVFGLGDYSLTHEIGHALGCMHSLLPGMMTIQNFGIVPKKFTSDSVAAMSTYVDTFGGCISKHPHANVIA